MSIDTIPEELDGETLESLPKFEVINGKLENALFARYGVVEQVYRAQGNIPSGMSSFLSIKVNSKAVYHHFGLRREEQESLLVLYGPDSDLAALGRKHMIVWTKSKDENQTEAISPIE